MEFYLSGQNALNKGVLDAFANDHGLDTSYRSAVSLVLEMEKSQLFKSFIDELFAVACGTSNGSISSTGRERFRSV